MREEVDKYTRIFFMSLLSQHVITAVSTRNSRVILDDHLYFRDHISHIYYSKFAMDHYLGRYSIFFGMGITQNIKMICIRGHVYFLNDEIQEIKMFIS